MDDVLRELDELIRSREGGNPTKSYVASVLHEGGDHILKKLGEEATETIIAGKNENLEELIKEIADLWFHTLVLMAQHEIHPEDILGELGSRQGVSGIAEKRMRGTIFKG